MASIKRVRLTKNDRAKLKRLERNVKAKQARIKRNYGVNQWFNFMPLEMIKDMTRKDLNSYYASLESFTNRNNHRYKKINDVTVPYDQYRELSKNIDETNRQRSKYRNKLNRVLGNTRKHSSSKMTPLEFTQGLLGSQKMHYYESVNKKQILNSITSTDQFRKLSFRFKEFSSSIFLDEKAHQMRLNYMTAVRNAENGLLSDTSGEIVDEIVNSVNKMSDFAFVALYMSDEDLDFIYIYEDIDKALRAEYILSKIERFEREYKD